MWKEMPIEFPNDEQVVWCRRTWFASPFKATFSVTNQNFETSTGYVIPWYEVWRWRPLE